MNEQQTIVLRQAVPLADRLGIGAIDVGSERVVLEMTYDPSSTTTGGATHGGAIMAIADTAAATLAYLNLPEGAAGTTTIESKTNFVGAHRAGRLIATATLLHRGSTTIVVETETRTEERLVAKTIQTQLVMR